MFNKPHEQLILEDVANLIVVGERESHHLDYKKEISNSDNDKKEFLKDVSSFANASGGTLILGVEEENGLPKTVCGTDPLNGRQKIDEWIDNVLTANLEPKIKYFVKILSIPESEKVVIVINIPESFKKPHMVTFQEKNIYYVRHNTTINAAIHSEVRDMFEYSSRLTNDLESFFAKRNILDESQTNFGIHENSMKLANTITEKITAITKNPFALFSFVPRLLEENRFNTIDPDFLQWLEQNSRGYLPNQNTDLFQALDKRINLFGVVMPKKQHREGNDIERYWHYFEILNNGFFESGLSEDVFWTNSRLPERIVPVTHLTYIVGHAWMLFNFAKNFFTKIGYQDEVVFQLSMVNIKNFALGGFGSKNGRRWLEPLEQFYYEFPVCTDHERFKIIERFTVADMSNESIARLAWDLASKLSRAFGVVEVKCFDENRNFNSDLFSHFRR
ncbi:MAG: Divergent AAA protein [uncultured bacterium]|nr:MAG: Divergent AAA protein [uncultured bacterium]